MTIVTPSQWLADITKQSFLKDYPIKLIPNGVDLSVLNQILKIHTAIQRVMGNGFF